jgi:hypothetical protein
MRSAAFTAIVCKKWISSCGLVRRTKLLDEIICK